MSISDADVAFARELFAPLGAITQRKMFGGLSLYCAGDIFCIVSSDGQIFLKAQGAAAEALKAEGSTQFHKMPYWSLPDDLLDDPEAASNRAEICMASLV